MRGQEGGEGVGSEHPTAAIIHSRSAISWIAVMSEPRKCLFLVKGKNQASAPSLSLLVKPNVPDSWHFLGIRCKSSNPELFGETTSIFNSIILEELFGISLCGRRL